MSYILEALKKSDQSRRRAGVPDINTHQATVVKSRVPSWMPPLIAILLLVIIGLLYWLLMQKPVTETRMPPVVVKQEAVLPASPEKGVIHKAVPDPVVKPVPEFTQAVPLEPDVVPVLAVVDDVALPLKTAFEPYADVMLWADLSSALRAEMPRPKLDVHVYAENSSRRFVLIDLSKYRESDQLASGAVIEAIVSDGVVLSYEGLRYKLRRP